jgi:hypothetical protein
VGREVNDRRARVAQRSDVAWQLLVRCGIVQTGSSEHDAAARIERSSRTYDASRAPLRSLEQVITR